MRPLFYSDYLEGAHPAIMDALSQTNFEQTPGYGEDHHCKAAADLIRKACELPNADVHFLVGGTQTNATVNSPSESVVRVCTSWATPDSAIDTLLEAMTTIL